MKKTDLVEAVAVRLDSSKEDALNAVNAVIDEIVYRVTAGEKVTVTGFGTFEAAHREARTANNPRTGEPMQVKAHALPRFKPGATFKRAVNR